MPVEETPADVALDVLSIVGSAAFGLAVGVLLAVLLGVLMRLLMRRHEHLKPFSRRLKLPVRVVLTTLGAGLGVIVATGGEVAASVQAWRPHFLHGYFIALIFSGALVTTGIVNAFQDTVVAKREDVEETPHARRIRTQAQVIGRVGIAVVWIIAIAGALLTFEQFRAVGASLLASAGLLSIVAGLAAQSSLANIFAGVQVAFTDALRVGDLVIVDGYRGTVEEITLTYVVVASWDGRRWIVPSTFFISNTFENLTRLDSELLGTIEFDLDWLVPMEAMRIQLQRIVRRSDLWDGRHVSLQMTDAQGGQVKIRAVVSASAAGDLWDLQCFVREELVNWIQLNAVYALPRTRLEPEPTPAPPTQEREAFISEVKQAWADERAADPTEEIEVELDEETSTADAEAAGHRSWFQAIRGLRGSKEKDGGLSSGAAEVTELIASVLRDATEAPTEDELREGRRADDGDPTRVDHTDGRGDSLSSTARMFSGSPEANALNRRYSGRGVESEEKQPAPDGADRAER
ncbi:mechanosensitive ion channel family protein [Tessaracoccus sp. OH4464_COT-324]|uniref:mechanosensitive ion channel family protein n=1 Tax=Tessaracoccus sp. OH4464_COT-324 TaxID=2491059 RepID=UPI000F637D3A|nr:mechanosensitive ion channel domain-containing protein [Tessaracoccus sp. OH4464_COT-324]RRD47028.1 mechanosensitive ion channel family protein [Tessaracoccus sp. OH4464_COT-324]